MVLTAILDAGRDFSILGLFQHADPVVKAIMFGLVLCSIACWALIFEKALRLRKLKSEVAGLEAMSAAGRLSAEPGSGFVGALTVAAQSEWAEGARAENRYEVRDRIERSMRGALRTELKRLEVGLPFLATIGSAAPFIGLFGTVWGIMNSFTAIAQSHDTSLAVVAPGLAEALFATAIGLAAAIPAVMAYNQIAVSLGRYGERAATAIALLARNLARKEDEPAQRAKAVR